MASTTTIWGFRKPAGSDTVDVDADLNAMLDDLDANLGILFCTSSTRPASPVDGQRIYETDTRRGYMWTGTIWLQQSGPAAWFDLTYVATVTPSMLDGRRFRLVMTGDVAFNGPTSPVDGDEVIFELTASGADRTATFNTGAGHFAFGSDIDSGSITATTSGTTDFVGAIYRSSADRWRVISYAKGY